MVEVKLEEVWGNGSGLIVDDETILTCDHVVRRNGKTPEEILITIAVALVVAIGFSSTTGAAYALSETERYNSGYNHGYMDAKNGVASYCSSDHTYTYCQGYNAGYQAVQVKTKQTPYQGIPPAGVTPKGVCKPGEYLDQTNGILTCRHKYL